jgi:type II secretory pathway component PulJ
VNAFSSRHQVPDLRRPAGQPRVVHFTLLELLLAIAVLLILLGFLFQFINSTQKVWTAAEKTAVIFAQAQISLQLLEKDLQAGLFSNEADNPGHAMLLGIGNDKFFFFTQDSTTGGDVGTYLVMYTWNDGVLMRYVWDEEIEGRPAHFFYGLDPAGENATDIVTALSALQADSDKGCVLATGVSDISIESPPGTDLTEESEETEGNGFPKVIKITLTLHDARAVQVVKEAGAGDEVAELKKAETERKFCKIVFLR